MYMNETGHAYCQKCGDRILIPELLKHYRIDQSPAQRRRSLQQMQSHLKRGAELYRLRMQSPDALAFNAVLSNADKDAM